MKRILVVGASSYIGRSFKEYVDRLHAEDGWEIDLVGARNEEWKALDFHGYDTVLHAAAVVHQKERRAGEDNYRRINYELPLKIADKAKKSGVKQLVFLSTMAVYGDKRGRISSSTKASPCTFYGKYKRMAEIDLWKKKADDFKVAIVRPPMVYGKGCKGNFGRLLKLSSVCAVFPEIENRRSMIYIDNLCEYMYLVVKKEVSGLGCPQNKVYVETTDLYRSIRAAQGKRTMSITIFNPLIKYLIKKVNFLDKLFSDCYYDLEQTRDRWSGIGLDEYQVVGYKGSIERSTGRSKGNYL